MKKIALVTGSTRGIGKSIALNLLHSGYNVILNGVKNSEHAKELTEDLKKTSYFFDIYYFDVSNIKEVELESKKILKKYSRIDVIVNNAGITNDNTLMKMNYKQWDTVIKTNLYSLFNVTKQFLPSMIENNFGRIINISSIIGIQGNYGQTNYSASKAGVIGFTKSLAKEVAKYNITVNAVCPGFTNTDMVTKIPKEILNDKIIERIPLKRLGKPKEVADLVNFLVSNKSSYITGEYFCITGGLT
jgi:3-oxoacyl-[acyl-carrier protein] reductase